jgi:hypothetical protein
MTSLRIAPLPRSCAFALAFPLEAARNRYIPLRIPSRESFGIGGISYCSFITVR